MYENCSEVEAYSKLLTELLTVTLRYPYGILRNTQVFKTLRLPYGLAYGYLTVPLRDLTELSFLKIGW